MKTDGYYTTDRHMDRDKKLFRIILAPEINYVVLAVKKKGSGEYKEIYMSVIWTPNPMPSSLSAKGQSFAKPMAQNHTEPHRALREYYRKFDGNPSQKPGKTCHLLFGGKRGA